MNYESGELNQENYRNNIESIPEQYKPLSPWAYVGYNILFAIPIIGLIALLILAFNQENIHRRNYARSYFCAIVIVVIPMIALAMIIFKSSSDVVTSANFALFMNEMSMIQSTVDMSAMEMKGNYMAEGNRRSDAQIYYEIATGKISDEEVPNGERFSLDFLNDGEVCYEIVDFSKIMGYENGENLELNGDRTNKDKCYITSEGKVFTLPGYEREENDETYYYFNANDYMAEDEMSL